MKRFRDLPLIGILLSVVVAGQQPAGPQQPILFSHKGHTAAGVKCLDCHTIRKPGFAAGFPQEGTCMGCHASVKTDSPEIQKLAAFHKAKEPVPWVRVYQVPDFVWFSHEVHYRIAHIGCENCHGPVADRDIIAKEKPTSMNSCVECHEKSKASTGCATCHDIH